jgi:hypothetical protein
MDTSRGQSVGAASRLARGQAIAEGMPADVLQERQRIAA